MKWRRRWRCSIREKPDVIVNFAAQGEGAASFGDNCGDWYRTNVLGLVRLTSALAKRQYLKRFIQIGSSEVYGGNQQNAKESDSLRPTSPYGVSKAAFDMHLDIVHRVHGFPANVVRPVNCYVRGQQLHRIIPKATLCAVGGKKLPLQGGGKSEKSYLHSTDLSRALMVIIEKAPAGEVYNVGPLTPTAIRDLVAEVAKACDVPFEVLVEEAPERIGQDSRYWLDSSKLRALGWEPSVSLETGLDEMVRWVRAHPELQSADTEYRHRP
jgi:dTDP-glucose 4,6-dehydratase